MNVAPRLFVLNTCRHCMRTVPALLRDEMDTDDVDPRAEDHVGNEARSGLPIMSIRWWRGRHDLVRAAPI